MYTHASTMLGAKDGISVMSLHLCLACSVSIICVMQYLVGLYAYLFPKVAIRNRRALGPLHQFAGRAAFTAGLATMAVSILHCTNCHNACHHNM